MIELVKSLAHANHGLSAFISQNKPNIKEDLKKIYIKIKPGRPD
jgi:hypothetical protein